MNDEEVRARHPTSLMDENEGCIFFIAHAWSMQRKKDTRQKRKRHKVRSKKVRKKQKIVKILAYVKKSSNFVAVKVYKIIKENKLWKHQLN